MNLRPITAFFFALLLGLSFCLKGQRFTTTNSFDRISKVTVGFSGNTYFGELRRSRDPNLQAGLGFGIGYEHLMTDNLGIRAQLSYYTIRANDSIATVPSQRARNLNFKANNIEFVVQGVYYTHRHPAKGYRDRAFVNPFFHLGIGVTSNNPVQNLNGTDYNMRALNIEGEEYGGLALIVPLGFGVDIFVSKNWDIQLDLQYNVAFTGYLDDVSGVYRDQASFTDTDGVSAITLAQLSDPRTVLTPPLAPVDAGTLRGDGSNDSYMRASIKLAYYLPKSLYGKSSIRCRVIKKTR